MKRIALILVIVAAYTAYDRVLAPETSTSITPTVTQDVQSPVQTWQANQQVKGSGKVTRILSDDNEGSRHQRFILEVPSGQTLLIAHNIDLAPRISGLRIGDTVAFYGVYEINPQGGVIHWTHHDPQGRHIDGWLEHNGRRYQ